MCPAQDHFRLLTCSITSVTLVFSLTHMFVFLSRYVMLNILLSICVCAAASLFFAWVVSDHVSVSLLEVCMSCRFVSSSLFQCYLEYVAVLGKCCPCGRDSSLHFLVLVFVSGAVSLYQVDVVFNVLDLSVVDLYWCVVFHHHLCLRLVHLQTMVFTFIS